MKKLRVGIIFGGKSAEHEISLQSAKNIINAIDKFRFEVLLLGIDKEGKWYLTNEDSYLQNATSNSKNIIINPSSENNIAIVPGLNRRQLIDTRNAKPFEQIDVIFPIVHGTIGEDGSLQGMLRIANLPFVGSDLQSSAICMDKDVTKRLLRDAGLQVAPFFTLTRGKSDKYTCMEILSLLNFPLFIKPARQGSSVGISKVSTESELINGVRFAFNFDDKIVIEQNVKGREIECAVLGNDNPQASTCAELVLKNEFYSYNTKYCDKKKVDFIVPALVDSSIKRKIQEIAIEAYKTLGCCGMARVDMFLTSKNDVVINEINTLPGFTNISMFPILWEASGISYPELITRLIELALERDNANKALKTSVNN